jgi:N-acetyl sugar amidotransferase
MTVNRCSKCLTPDTRPEITFNSEGICDACISAVERHKDIDWIEREKEFKELIEQYKGKGEYDCIVASSGGKDSTYQLLKVLEYGLKPLVVTFGQCEITPTGQHNLDNIAELGVDHILFRLNRKLYKKLFKIGFELAGDCCYVCHLGIFSYPIRVAVEKKIPLIIYGENPQSLYGGPKEARGRKTMDKSWLPQFGGLNNLRPEDLIGMDGITETDIIPLTYPSDEELKNANITALFLGSFFPWEARENLDLVKNNGFKFAPQKIPGALATYENVDCSYVNIHDYMCYLKYGFGRATTQASIDLRNGYFSRDAILPLVEQCDKELDYKILKNFCDFIGITEEQFWEVANSFKGDWNDN